MTEIPLEMIQERPTRNGYAVVQGEERVLDVAVKSGSQITLSVGGYVVRVRAVEEK